jgi:diacylglycerol kinase family enzyme
MRIDGGGDAIAERFPLDVDGEPRGLLPLTARVLPHALRIRG